MTVTKFMVPFLLGMAAVAFILWSRVDACQHDSPTKQCAIWFTSGGIQLAQIQWPGSGEKPK